MRGVRARLLLILLVAVILPNVLLAIWIGRSARASALALLDQQLHERLASAARTIGHRWIELRSPLLTLAEDPRVVEALRDTASVGTPLRLEVGPEASIEGVVDQIVILDNSGRARVELSAARIEREGAGALPIRLVIHDADGTRVGTLETRLALSALLPPLYGWGAAAGAIPAVLSSDGTPLVSVSIEQLLNRERRFVWEGEEWLAAYRDVHDPPLRLSLAVPATPHTTPFTDAARRGALSLLVVLGGSVLLTLILSRQVSAPLARLTAAAEEVAQGRLEGDTVRETGPDEVRRLGRAFNTMTESLRRLIRRVSQQESAAAVGEFAASLAHEVRNPLTSVRLDLERARERLDRPEAAEELVTRALEQIERLDATVSGALRLARSGSLELTPLELKEPIGAALRTARALFARRAVHVAPWTPPTAPLYVRGNAAAIEQMLLNLLMNAADAVDGDGREGAAPDPSVVVEVEGLPSVIQLRVRDAGRGMTPQEMEQATEPFFTTRPDGTGLGLTVVQRIAQAHGAAVAIESSKGAGTTVTVAFPRWIHGVS
jgi:signal transduction histidine kinase